MYLSLQLQNHKGHGFRLSWRVAKKISKLPSWRGLQKNHTQLQHFPGKSLLKFFRKRNFKIMARQSYPLRVASRKIMLNVNLLKNSLFFQNVTSLGVAKFQHYLRGSHEHPIEQTKQTVKVKSSYQSQQRNANQSKASKGS